MDVRGRCRQTTLRKSAGFERVALGQFEFGQRAQHHRVGGCEFDGAMQLAVGTR